MKDVKKYLWLVGEVFDADNNSWIFQGIYTKEEKAVGKCVSDNFFIARVELDFDEPTEEIEFDFMYYPLIEDRPKEKQIKISLLKIFTLSL